MGSELALRPHGRLTKTSYEPPPDLDEAAWREDGRLFARMGRTVQWWIGDWYLMGAKMYGERKAEIFAARLGLKPATVKAYATVSRRYEKSRRLDFLDWSYYQSVASQSDRVELLKAAHENGWTVIDLRRHVRLRRLRKKAAEQKRAPVDEIEDVEPPAADLLYHVIYADPPWRYEHAVSSSREIENQYPTMSLDDLCELDVPAADDAVLFLWATSPKLEEALEVLRAWRFTYRTNAVWVKDRIGMGYYVRQRHELLLIGARGELPTPLAGARYDSVIEAPRGRHSEKPTIVYDMLEDMYPEFELLELFARRKYSERWTAWGNEVGTAA